MILSQLKKVINLEYRVLTKDRIADTLDAFGNRVSSSYLEGADIKGHTFFNLLEGKRDVMCRILL